MADEKTSADMEKVLQATSMNAAFTLDVLLHWPIRHSILLVGDTGAGKDGLVRTAAATLGCPLIDIRLSQNDVGDIKGMPFRVKGRTVWAPPDWMPFKDEEARDLDELMGEISTAACKRASAHHGILFLNEINRAPRDVQQAAFELVLDRTMNTRVLKEGWRIVAAVNGDDHYQVNVMDVAFKARFFVIKFRPTVEEWLSWADDPVVKKITAKPEVREIIGREITDSLHPAVTGFIRKMPKMLDPTEEMLTQSESDVTRQVQNRRAWHMFSDALKVREALAEVGEVPSPIAKDQKSLNYLMMMATGYVGSLAAIEFMRYIESDYQSLSGDIILNKWDRDVAGRVKSIVERGGVIEISRYNEMIVSEVGETKALSSAQKKNLTAYVKILTKEMVAHLWMHFLKVCREACMNWYESKDVQDLVVGALKIPK